MKFFHIAKLESESIEQYQTRARSMLFKWNLGMVGAYVCFAALFIHFVRPAQMRDPLAWLPFLGGLSAPLIVWLRRRHEERYVKQIQERMHKAEADNGSRLISH